MSFQSAKRPSLSDFEYGAYGMSLNLNCVGKLDVDGPQPPSGLSLIGGSENEAMFTEAVERQLYRRPPGNPKFRIALIRHHVYRTRRVPTRATALQCVQS